MANVNHPTVRLADADITHSESSTLGFEITQETQSVVCFMVRTLHRVRMKLSVHAKVCSLMFIREFRQ